jgi:hypothetical protein
MIEKQDTLKQKQTNKELTQQVQDELKKEGKNISDFARNIKIAPSKRAILQLPKDLLIKHNALIFHKGSSLSSTQRKMVQERVAYGVNRGIIEPQEVADEINKLNALIQGEIIKQTKDADILTDK